MVALPPRRQVARRDGRGEGAEPRGGPRDQAERAARVHGLRQDRAPQRGGPLIISPPGSGVPGRSCMPARSHHCLAHHHQQFTPALQTLRSESAAASQAVIALRYTRCHQADLTLPLYFDGAQRCKDVGIHLLCSSICHPGKLAKEVKRRCSLPPGDDVQGARGAPAVGRERRRG